MEVRHVSAGGVERIQVDDVWERLARRGGFTWIDVADCDEEVAAFLRDRFDLHPSSIQACRERSHLPTFHGYRDSWFVVVHRPLIRRAGHVHLLQLEFFVREDVLITVHGPNNPDVDETEVFRDTVELRRRLDAGRVTPESPSALAHELLASLARSYRAEPGDIARRVAELEQDVMSADLRSPEGLLDRMFLLRHELMTVRTMAGAVHEVFGRMAVTQGTPQSDDRVWINDVADRFARLRVVADGEREFLAGVIDYYQTKTATKMTVAMERLAVLAAVTLPVTALASIYGMNVIVNDRTHWVQLTIAIAVMLTISGLLLRWTKRQGWW